MKEEARGNDNDNDSDSLKRTQEEETTIERAQRGSKRKPEDARG